MAEQQLIYNYYYASIQHGVFLLGIITMLYMLVKKRIPQGKWISLGLLILIAYFIGRLPIVWETYGDRTNYASGFLGCVNGLPVNGTQSDILFNLITKIIAQCTDNPHYYLTILSGMYFFAYGYALKRLSRGKGLWVILMVTLTTMGFFAYSSNTIRSGIAIATVMLSISLLYDKKYVWCIVAGICAVNVHYSAMLPIMGLLLGFLVKKPKYFIGLWIVCFLVSFFGDDSLTEGIAPLIDDSRSERYLRVSLADAAEYYRAGFRWDFIAYSLVPIVTGYLFIYKFKDITPFYKIVYNAYLCANAFWLLVIRAPFTDRFAYLSWFLMPIIYIFPLLQVNLKVPRRAMIAAGFLAYNLLFSLVI